MSTEFRERVKSLFYEAEALGSARRSAFLDEVCGSDARLRAEIESLLAVATEAPVTFMQVAAFQPVGKDVPRPGMPARIGQYTLLSQLGEGGMGSVFEARQASPSRTVAIKLIRSVLATPQVLRRFDREAQLLGQLQHPGIATVYEAGTAELISPTGAVALQPFIAMERIHGRPLTAYVREKGLRARQILELFSQVCDAVHHAHERGVIHRDLKPANILVSESGVPKILDFGVARLTDADALATTLCTEIGQLVGTLPYMSPEQVQGGELQVDARADVYALGVLLYELLSDRLPLDLKGRTIVESVQIIQQVDPTRLGSFNRTLRGDIETIVEKALEKDRARRYPSAAAFAADIRRFLQDEPIVARPATTWYQLQKFARRNKGLVAGVMVAGCALLVGLLFAVHQAMVATGALTLAEQRERLSVRAVTRANISAASAALTNHDIALARRSLERIPESHRGWEWYYLSAALDHSLVAISLPPPGHARTLAFRQAEDGLVVSACIGEDVVEWNATDGTPYSASAPAGPACSLDFSHLRHPAFPGALDELRLPDAERLAVSPNRHVIVWAIGDQVFRRDSRHPNVDVVRPDRAGTEIERMAVADDGRVVFAAAVDGKPAVWPPNTKDLIAVPHVDSFVRSIALNPEGDRIVAGMQNTTIQVWDSQSLELIAVARGHTHAVRDVAYSPDGGMVASASLDRTVRLWDAATLAPRAVLHGHMLGISRLAFSPNGNHIATLADDHTLRIFNARTIVAPGVLTGHQNIVFPVVFSPDGSLIASAGWDRTIRIWNASTYAARESLVVDADLVSALAISPDNGRLAAVSDNGWFAWDLTSGQPLPRPDVTDSAKMSVFPVRVIDFDARGTSVLLPGTTLDAPLSAWNTLNGRVTTWEPRSGGASASRRVSPDGRFVVYTRVDPDSDVDLRSSRSDSGAMLDVVELGSGRRLPLPRVSGPFSFNPEVATGVHLAARLAEDRTRVGIWNLDTGKRTGELSGHAGDVYAIAYSPDATRIATAGRDGLRLWNADLAEEIMELRGHRSFVWSVVFSPDGSQLASGSGDGTVRIWDTRGPASRRSDRDLP